MATVAKLENGLRKLKMAQLNDEGSYGDIFTVADMTQITAETSEGETKLAAGNAVIYSKKSKGSTTGTVGFYSTDEDTEAKIFGYKKNAAGNILYGMTENKIKTIVMSITVIIVYIVTDINKLSFLGGNIINFINNINSNILYGIIFIPLYIFEILSLYSYLKFLKTYDSNMKVVFPLINISFV